MSRRSLFVSLAVVTSVVALQHAARAEGASAVPNGDTPAAAPSTAPAPASAPSAPSNAPAPYVTSPPSPDKVADPEDSLRTVYVGFSPLHLILPMFVANAEVKLAKHFGVGAFGGFGTIQFDGYKFKVWEAGGQFLAYPVGDFDHGMQLGAEVMYKGVTLDEAPKSIVEVKGAASGLGISPLIGYKYATKVGFTLTVQGGVTFYAVQANASDNNGNTAAKSDQLIAPLLNFNIGWSF